MQRVLCAALLSCACFLNACHRGATLPPQSTREDGGRCAASPLDALACEYVELGLALGERDPDSLDFSVAPKAVAAKVHKEYPRLEQIARRAEDLRSRLGLLPLSEGLQQERARVLDLQLRSLEARVGILRGQVLPFDAEAAVLFDTRRLPDTGEGARKEVRALIAHGLPGKSAAVAGVSLAARYADYDRRFLVRGDRVADVMHAALAVCREHTARFLSLPSGEGVELAFVHHQPWSAFSRYLGHGKSTLLLNADMPVTVDEVLELACHEGYPGHHMFNTLREVALINGQHQPEAEIQLTFSPQSYVSEAAAAFAPRLTFSLEERTRVERDILFPLAGLPVQGADRYVRLSDLVRALDSAEPAIARDYLDGQLEFVRAEQALADEALMAHAEASLLYLNEYRSYMLAYTDGRRRIAALVDPDVNAPCRARNSCTQDESSRRWKAYGQLMREFRVVLP